MTENKAQMTYYDAFDNIRNGEFKKSLQELEKISIDKDGDLKETMDKISRKFYDFTTVDYNNAFPEYKKNVEEYLKNDYKTACKFYKEKEYNPVLNHLIVTNILTQDMMAEVYRKNHVRPEEVAEFVNQQLKSADLTEIIEQHALVYGNAAREDESSNEKLLDPCSNKSKEYLQYINDMTTNKCFGKAMHDFAVQKELERTMHKKEESKLQKLMHKAGKYFKAFLEVGRIAVIATGMTSSAYIVKELLKDNENNKTNTEKSIQNIKSNSVDSKTYTSWAGKSDGGRH